MVRLRWGVGLLFLCFAPTFAMAVSQEQVEQVKKELDQINSDFRNFMQEIREIPDPDARDVAVANAFALPANLSGRNIGQMVINLIHKRGNDDEVSQRLQVLPTQYNYRMIPPTFLARYETALAPLL